MDQQMSYCPFVRYSAVHLSYSAIRVYDKETEPKTIFSINL